MLLCQILDIAGATTSRTASTSAHCEHNLPRSLSIQVKPTEDNLNMILTTWFRWVKSNSQKLKQERKSPSSIDAGGSVLFVACSYHIG
jgi:hypothetical protein